MLLLVSSDPLNPRRVDEHFVVRRRDGIWRIVELGDGQVSDRPRSTPPEQLIAALWP